SSSPCCGSQPAAVPAYPRRAGGTSRPRRRYARDSCKHGHMSAATPLPIGRREPIRKMVSSHARHADADELESFFSVTPDLVCLADIEGRFTRVNPAWTELLGWSSAELTGQPYFGFIHPDDVERTQSAAAALADGETVMRFENRYAAKDGSYHWLSWRAKVDQRTGLIAAIARDVTQRREAEEQLIELNTRLEH